MFDLANAKNPVILMDFSDESISLLIEAQKVREIPVLVFRETLTDMALATKIITDYDLTAYFYKPFEVRGTTLFYNVGKGILQLTGTPCRPALAPHFPWVEVIAPSTFPYIEGVIVPRNENKYSLAA